MVCDHVAAAADSQVRLNQTMFETWLTAWLLGIAAIAGAIAASWSVDTYR